MGEYLSHHRVLQRLAGFRGQHPAQLIGAVEDGIEQPAQYATTLGKAGLCHSRCAMRAAMARRPTSACPWLALRPALHPSRWIAVAHNHAREPMVPMVPDGPPPFFVACFPRVAFRLGVGETGCCRLRTRGFTGFETVADSAVVAAAGCGSTTSASTTMGSTWTAFDRLRGTTAGATDGAARSWLIVLPLAFLRLRWSGFFTMSHRPRAGRPLLAANCSSKTYKRKRKGGRPSARFPAVRVLALGRPAMRPRVRSSRRRTNMVIRNTACASARRDCVAGGDPCALAAWFPKSRRVTTSKPDSGDRRSASAAELSLHDISALAVTRGPGLIGALLVAVQAGKALAFARGLPLVGVNHLEGHLLSAYLSETERDGTTPHVRPPLPHLGLLVSGGHSSLVLVRDFGDYQVLGTTCDDAVGKRFDKVGKLLGLGFIRRGR